MKDVSTSRSSTASVPVVSNSAPASGQARIGVVGAGQLARMMGEVAHEVGVTITVLANDIGDAAVATCDQTMVGASGDEVALRALADGVDVVTFDHELVDLELLERLEADGVLLRPNTRALRFAVDKVHQRRTLAEAGLPVPRFIVVNDASDRRLETFLETLSHGPVVKSPRGGYDGRGVYFPDSIEATKNVVDDLSRNGEVLIEERLALLGEYAQQIARGVDGELAFYPVVESVQAEAMCVEVRYPSGLRSEVENEAAELTMRVANLVQHVGMLAVEYFFTDRGLVINELALRPHNTGHWTIEGAVTNQFSQHLLAVSGQALGPVTPTSLGVVMVNVVGTSIPGSLDDARGVPGVFVHDYGKSWREGRKLGHVTAIDGDVALARVRAWESARAYGTATKET